MITVVDMAQLPDEDCVLGAPSLNLNLVGEDSANFFSSQVQQSPNTLRRQQVPAGQLIEPSENPSSPDSFTDFTLASRSSDYSDRKRISDESTSEEMCSSDVGPQSDIQPLNDPSLTRRAASDLEEILNAEGLDPEFWKPIFKTELGITKSQQIVHLELDEIESIGRHCRYKWENNALNALLIQTPVHVGATDNLNLNITLDDRSEHGVTSDILNKPDVLLIMLTWKGEQLDNLHSSNQEQESSNTSRRQEGQSRNFGHKEETFHDLAKGKEFSENPSRQDGSAHIKEQRGSSDYLDRQRISHDGNRHDDSSDSKGARLSSDYPGRQKSSNDPVGEEMSSDDVGQQSDSLDLNNPSKNHSWLDGSPIFKDQQGSSYSLEKQRISDDRNRHDDSSDSNGARQSSDNPGRHRISNDPVVEEMSSGDVGPQRDSQDLFSCERSKNSKDHFDQILEKLGLGNYYPSKMSFRQVMKIRKDQEEEKISSEDIPWIILRKLVMTDSTARDKVLQKWNDIRAQKGSNKHPLDVSGILDGLSITLSEAELHPLDVFLAIFTSCDLMLKQALLQKMFMCRLAIPLIYPDPNMDSSVLSVWALRKISVEWVDKDQKAFEENIVDGKHIKAVSFLRYGRPMISKSQILNNVVESPTHSTFFDKDSPSGDADRLVANGLVEATWYIPSGSGNDIFQDCTLFLNMRGDAGKHAETMQVIRMISKVMVIFIDANDVKEAAFQQMMRDTSKCMLILLILNATPGTGTVQKVLESLRNCIGAFPTILTLKKSGTKLIGKNASELKSEIQRAINQLLMRSQNLTSIDDLGMKCSKMKNIFIDEMDPKCQWEKEHAEQLLQNITKKEIEDILPLQRDTWMKLSKLLKKSARSKCDDMNKKDKITQSMKEVRHMQFERCKRLDSMVETFIEVLSSKQVDKLIFLLEWLKIILDKRTREVLPGVYKDYHMKRKSLKEAMGKQNRENQKKCLENLEKSEANLARSSFGLEHLFREIGQIFEAFSIERQIKAKPSTEYLPRSMAKLLSNGVPLEIMDGDSGCVPSTWVNAVLEALQALIGNRKIFVISVLGIQSSGKSTMLNAMFGLQFPVSAGRCTRGVYLQLVEVDKNCGLDFDYVFVVDTEGLRAPELGSQNYTHDNELATLVTGLGDVTIMNIKGENLSEMQDILQIVVHAFLRMKAVNSRIKLKKKCVFIHQNVSAVNAKEKMGFGTNKMTDTLDQVAREAAIQENLGRVNRFRDIIDFDEEKHVQTIPDLWLGDPPNGAVNPGYSEKVNKIKQNIVNDSGKSFMTISDFSVHLKDLWNGVLHEDFVFSFKNTLAVRAYMEMESKYSQLTWDLQHNMNQLIDKIQIKISQVCSETILDDCCLIEEQNYGEELRAELEKAQEELEQYFDKCSQKDIAIQWKETKLKSLDVVGQELSDRFKSEMLIMKETQRVEMMPKNDIGKHEKQIMQKAKEIAAEMLNQGRKLGEDELKKAFEELWKDWISGVQQNNPVRKISIWEEVRKVLQLEFGQFSEILNQELEKRKANYSLNLDDIKSDHFDQSNWFNKIVNSKKIKQRILNYANDILNDIGIHLNNIQSQSKFHTNDVMQLIKTVRVATAKNNSTENEFYLTARFKVMLAVHACRHAIPVFQMMQDKYIQKNNIVFRLENYRTKVWNLFNNTVEKRKDEVIAGDLLLDAIKPAMLITIHRSLKTDIVNEIVHYFRRKHTVIVSILDDLAKKGIFQDGRMYLQNPKSYALKWITDFSKENVLGTEPTDKMTHFTDLARTHIRRIKDDLVEASKFVSDVRSTHQWARGFLDAVHGKIDLTSSDFSEFEQCDIGDFKNLNDNLLKGIEKLEGWAMLEIKSKYAKAITWGDSTPFQLATDTLWGCEALCPYCQEPCNKHDPKHYENDNMDYHVCVQHKPTGICGISHHNSEELVTETCDFSITTAGGISCTKRNCKDYDKHKLQAGNKKIYHPYKEYKKHIPDWDILPNANSDENKYWMLFMHKFNNELAEWHQLKPAEIPETWKSIQLQDALDSLRVYTGNCDLLRVLPQNEFKVGNLYYPEMSRICKMVIF